jgi:hypothetical protein
MLQATNVPAQIKKVEAIEDFVYARNMMDKVAPLRAAYKTNNPVAVEAFILCTLALIEKTSASSPIIKPKNINWLPNIARNSEGLLTT